MKKRLLTFVLAVLLCAGLLPAAAFGAEFKFIDVSPEAWYYNDVKTAVDSGLVNGKTETTYCPDDLLTYAEAVKLAACMHQKHSTGVVSLVNGTPWYQSYVDYAKMNGIISKDFDWDAKATRAGYMTIFAHALPDSALAAKNNVPDGSIPDVPTTNAAAPEIYKLYRAGILQGSDDTYNGVWTKHLCKPNDNIKRSEVAAILTRMMYVDKRISFSMGTQTDALKITKQPSPYVLKAAEEKVIFTVEISGGKAPYTYKWILEKEIGTNPNSEVSNEKKSSLAVQFRKDTFDFSKYVRISCEITDAAGTKVVSDKVEIVPFVEGMKVTKQPADYAMKSATDTEAAFSVEIAGGKAPYTYEWIEELDGIPTWYSKANSSETKNTFGVKDAAALLAQAKSVKLYCNVYDAEGTKVTSEKAELKAFVADFKITKQPKSVSAWISDTVTFSIEVSGGTAPYTYNWMISYNNGAMISIPSTMNGQPSLSFKVEESDFSSALCCVVTDAKGNYLVSDTVKITEGSSSDALKITKQPVTATMKSWTDANVPFSVTVSGGKAPYKFAWYEVLDGSGTYTITETSSSTNSMLVITNGKQLFDMANKVEIYCEITDADGKTVTSDKVRLYEPDEIPQGTFDANISPSGTQTVTTGDLFTATVTATGGTGSYSYEWEFSNDGGSTYKPLPSTTATQTVNCAYPGKVFLQCKVTSGAESVRVSVTIMIEDPGSLTVTSSESFMTLKKGQTVKLEPIVSGGTAPYTYEWYNGGETYSSGSGESYDYVADTVGNFGVRVYVTDAKGTKVMLSWNIKVTN